MGHLLKIKTDRMPIGITAGCATGSSQTQAPKCGPIVLASALLGYEERGRCASLK